MTTAYGVEIAAAAAAHRLDPVLVEAVVWQESSGRTAAYRYEPHFFMKYMASLPEYRHANPERVSASYGLMQTMFIVAKEVGFTETEPEYLFLPKIGLEFGCRKLAQLLKWSNGNVSQALAAYNGGRGGNSRPPYRNQIYVDGVMVKYMQLMKLRTPNANVS